MRPRAVPVAVANDSAAGGVVIADESSRPSREAACDGVRAEPPARLLSETYFDVRRRRLGAAVRVEVEGELDLATTPRLAGELAHAAAERASLIFVDLAGVTLLDSTTLHVLLRASLEVRAGGGELVVRLPDGPARRLFDLIGLERTLAIIPNGDSPAQGTWKPEPLGFLVKSLLDENAHLQRALTSRITIEQAKGILAARLQLDVDAAFDLLRKAARDRRRRLHDLAKAVVEGSEEANKLFVPTS